MADTYMTIKELAAHWGVTRRTVEKYRQKGIGPKPVPLLPGPRGLRYVRAEVEAYDNERKRARGEPVKEVA